MICNFFRKTVSTRPCPLPIPFRSRTVSPFFSRPWNNNIAKFSTTTNPKIEKIVHEEETEKTEKKEGEPKTNLLSEKAKQDFDKGLITEETFNKLKSLDDDEAEQRRGFKGVSSVVGGRKVAKFSGLKDMRLKRWYKDVFVKEEPENGKWSVHLDDRFIVTRNEKGLFLPNQKMAMLVASEWEIQEGLISLSTMPMMMLACRAIDDMPKFRDYYHNELLEFLVGDHVCFRDEDSARDYKKQMEFHQPIVDWFHKVIGLQLDMSKGCYVQKHPKKTIDTLNVYLSTLDDFTFHLFHNLAHSTKSVATALALWHNAITLDHAVSAVSWEEDLNTNAHGLIEGAHDLKKAQSFCDVASAAVLLQVCDIPPPNKETFELLGDASVILETREREDWERHKKLQEQMYGKLQDFVEQEMKGTGDKGALMLFAASLKQRKSELEQEWNAKIVQKQENK